MRGGKKGQNKKDSQDQQQTEAKEEAKELYVEEGPDLDVSLHFYQHYLLISFISIMASLLLADGCHLDATHAGTLTHTHTHTYTHTHTHTRT